MFTNEITIDGPNKKLNGNMIKKLGSGGDVMKARKNYCDEVEFQVQGRLFMFCNDLPPITPVDASETMTVFNFPYQFVSEPNAELTFQRQADETIKDYCARTDVRDAYLHMVLDAFCNHRVTPCREVREETSIFQAEAGDETALLREAIEFTGNDSDRLSSTDMMVWIKGQGINVSSQKIRQRLVKLGATFKEKLWIDGKNTRGYCGIRLRHTTQ
jgi:hypothetical protein